MIPFGTYEVPFGMNQIFCMGGDISFAVEICEDLWVPLSPGIRHALAGAMILVNLSAGDETTGKAVYGYDETTDKDGKAHLQNTNVLYLLSRFESGVKFGNENDFKGSVYQYISFLSDRLAETISYETSRNDTAKSTVDTLLDARDEVSGVQMDEEGINMLNYQKWYSASSRMLTTMDDALDKLINGTGRVGL